jgi:hypothetical protein
MPPHIIGGDYDRLPSFGLGGGGLGGLGGTGGIISLDDGSTLGGSTRAGPGLGVPGAIGSSMVVPGDAASTSSSSAMGVGAGGALFSGGGRGFGGGGLPTGFGQGSGFSGPGMPGAGRRMMGGSSNTRFF